MSLVACPGCGMPRTAEDLAARPCPLCGDDPAPADALAPSVVAAPTPPAATATPVSPSRASRWLWLLLAALLPMAVGVCVYALWPAPEPDPNPAVPLHQPQPIAESLKPLPAKPPVGVAKLETAPVPRVAPVEEPFKPVAIVPPAPVEPDPPAEGAVVLNKPNGEYVIPQATGDDAIVLTGEVGVLKIGRVSGRALVDATKLKAKVIVVTDRMDEEGELRLRATERIEFHERIDGAAKASAESPTGTVRFATDAARIDGSAKVTVNAARAEFVGKVDGGSKLAVTAGAVVFGAENGDGCLAGGARLTVTAKDVDIRCPMIGGVNVAVTVAASGRIAHKNMEGGAKLTYRKAGASDPEPTVISGEIRGGATVSKER